MEEIKYLHFCPKHGRKDDEAVCPKCGRETILSDITWDEFRGYLQADKDDPAYTYSYLIEKSFKVGLDKILTEFRTGKNGKVETALKLLVWRPERDDYIEEVTKWMHESRGKRSVAAAAACALFLSRCSYEKVRLHLDFRDYNHDISDSVKLFMPFFLEHYKYGRPLYCEQCKKEAGNLFIKIHTEKKVLSAVRHVGYITQQLQYTGVAEPHAYCDECALKKANKQKRLKDLSDAEKIRGFMTTNQDLNIRTCNDTNIGLIGDIDTGGFSYEYLVSPAAAEEMVKNEADRAVLAGMIECALGIKEDLEKIV